jgi:hypothetical protein
MYSAARWWANHRRHAPYLVMAASGHWCECAGPGSGVLGVSRTDGMRGSCLQRKRLDGLLGFVGYAPVAAVRSRKMTCS